MRLTARQKIERFEQDALAPHRRGWGYKTSDRQFTVKAVTLLAERLHAIEEALTNRQPKAQRPPTEWQKFFAEGMKAGKSAVEVAAEWRAR